MFVKLLFAGVLIVHSVSAQCPKAQKFGTGPPASCKQPTDPNNKSKSGIESWFTRAMFNDLFPSANLGWGPNACFPYSYEAFIIAARYFPRFGTEAGKTYSAAENGKRDLAAFFSHAVQETGENNIALYSGRTQQQADDCFYRGGFYNWFEGGPQSSFLPAKTKGTQPADGSECIPAGRYCSDSAEISAFYPCSKAMNGQNYKGCYFGRGAIQISYNYNYGQFQNWLQTQNINVDLLNTDPPLAIMASLWFYMTPQPPKPAMHDIVIGNWNAGPQNTAAGYSGAILGPTCLVINNECNGEDAQTPGGGGENRRIKAFKWFCKYFKVQPGADKTLTCKTSRINQIGRQPWKTGQACKCAPASYGGIIPYFETGYYPQEFLNQNTANAARCQKSIYANPQAYQLDKTTAPCLNTPING
ncbi:Chitinase class I [Aphelenchoides bicaudatus]|nr:Chitinase class I [Aphelenchoides bicaudatus]